VSIFFRVLDVHPRCVYLRAAHPTWIEAFGDASTFLHC